MAKQTEIEIKRATFITKFDLSPRVQNMLDKINIENLGQLADMERSHMFKHRHVGEKAVHELDRLLSKNGLSWKKEAPKLKPIKIKKSAEEIEITKKRRDVQAHNGMLVAENEKLTGEVLRLNLEKLRMEGRIKELEDKTQRLANLLAMK